jgi:tetratricopeptide (TPR) repeat protein
MPPSLLPVAKPIDVPQTFAQAFKHHQQGHLAEAEQLCAAILSVRPDHFDALHMRGLISLASGRLSEALHLIADAMRLRTPSPQILLNHGVVLNALSRHEKALESVNRAIKLKSRFSEAHSTRGAVLNALDRAEEALASLDRALALRPSFPEALYNRGIALEGLNRFEEALASYDRALALQPNLIPALSNRGGTLSGLKRFDEALVSCDRALALQPNLGQAHSNRGLALNGLKRFDDAVASYDRALAARPNDAELHYNRALTLTKLGRIDEALASYDRALSLRPEYAEAHLNDALLKLLTGDFSRGLAKYEWRWEKKSADVSHTFLQPPWLGEDAISGKVILIHSEQGLGDTIQFCRYVPLVTARGAHVIFEVAPPLQKLMTGFAGTAQVISRGDPLPDFDLHCPLLSLPLAFGTKLETIPSDVPYLQAPSSALTNWDTRLGPKGRPRIGLVWSGNAINERDRERSIDLRSFLPLLDVEATFVSLQKDVRAPDAALLRERGDILHLGDELEDFSATAELISQLDLVISVDTSVAHLAGALGKPVWILVTHIPDWRWLLDREDSPWYPTARLFRQPRLDDWDNVIIRVHEALREWVKIGS